LSFCCIVADGSVIDSKIPPDLTCTVLADKTQLHHSLSVREPSVDGSCAAGTSTRFLTSASAESSCTLPRRSAASYLTSPLLQSAPPTVDGSGDAGSRRGFPSDQSSTSSSIPLVDGTRFRQHQRRQSDPINRLSTAWSENDEGGICWADDSVCLDGSAQSSVECQRIPGNVDPDAVTWMTVDFNGARLALQQSGARSRDSSIACLRRLIDKANLIRVIKRELRGVLARKIKLHGISRKFRC
jgi:hypothetical protein